MTFLSGLFLIALPLIVVPVLIHLYRSRQREVIAWGAMRFLAQASTKGRRMERLEELLLMALRVGAIGAVILALAQPKINSSWWGASGESEVVLILDNSLSMALSVDGYSALDQLKENVRAEIEELSSSDQVHLMLAGALGQWLTAEGIAADSDGKKRLGALVDSLQPSLATSDLLGSLQKVMVMDSSESPTYRRVVMFTDNQAISWQIDEEDSWKQLGTARRDAAVPFSIEVVDCGLGETELNNLAVTELESARELVQPGDSVELSANVTNVGEVASESVDVQWLVDDEVVSTTSLESLEANQSTNCSTSLRLEEAGCFAISCRLAVDDQISLDQQSTTVVEVSDRIPILLVHDSNSETTTKKASQLFEAALGYEDGKVQSWHSIYEPKVVSLNALPKIILSDYRCVIFTNLSHLDGDSVEQLHNYVSNGGGLWVAIGERMSREQFNRQWYDDGNGLSPVSVAALETIADTNEPAGTIHPPSRQHPATLQLANTTQLDIDEARIHEHWRLATHLDTESDSESPNLSVLLESGDGSPLVVENYLGQGRILIQAFPLGLEWTNLPQLKSYVVMVHEWLDYLTAGATGRYNLSPGNTIVATTPPEARFASAELIAPDGHQTPLTSQGLEAVSMLRYSQTQLPGLYRIEFKADDEMVSSLPFYVANDAKESQLDFLEEEQFAKLASMAEIQFEGEEALAEEIATQIAPKEEPVWGILLVALLVLLAGELLLSNWLARQRTGVAISTG